MEESNETFTFQLMNHSIVIVLFFLLIVPGQTSPFRDDRGRGFDKVLQFPKEVSLENYVILRPDFTEIKERFSICAWVKFYRTDGNRYWFSYATGILCLG